MTGAGDEAVDVRARAELPDFRYAAFQAGQAQARERHATRAEYAFMTSVEIEADIARRAEGGPANIDRRNGDQRAADHATRLAIREEVLTARATDPAGWAMRDDAIAASFTAAQENPDNPALARHASQQRIALQREMGIEPRLLSDAERDEIAGALAEATPADRPALIADLRGQHAKGVTRSMRYFDLIAQGLDVMPLRHAVARQPGLWNANTLRTTYPGTVHGEVDDIWLRFDPRESLDTVIDGHESVDYPAFAALPQARPIVFDLMRRVEGVRLGRVLITRLRAGGRIYPHEDAGDHAAYYDRYQISLQGLPGCVFRAGDEQLTMASGEVWWFDNARTHEVVNNSAGDRIHMVVDIRT